MTLKVTAVVVNWNTVDLLDRCLTSLAQYGFGDAMDVVVVDNGSADGSADLVRNQWPNVHLIANKENRGYIQANNQGMNAARGEHLLLINSDAFLTPGALDKMVGLLDDHADAAVVGPRLVYGDGSWQRWTAGSEPALSSAMSFFLFADRLSGSAARRSLYLARDVKEPFRPDWVSSACMLVRREALKQVGPMDERYFCYMDDVDLCRRLRAAGWTVWYLPSAEAIHLMGQSTRRHTGAASPSALRNLNDYVTRINGPAVGASVRVTELIGFAIRAALYFVLPSSGSRERAQAHVRNMRNSLKSGPAENPLLISRKEPVSD